MWIVIDILLYNAEIITDAVDKAFAVMTLADVIFIVCMLAVWAFSSTNAEKRRLAAIGATMSGTMRHVSGLPMASGLAVEMLYCPDRLLFRSGGKEVTIRMPKVTDISLATKGNGERRALSGAASGKYAMGGAVGAVMGAAMSVECELVISYNGKAGSKTVRLDTFDGTGDGFPARVVNEYRKNHPSKVESIEL